MLPHSMVCRQGGAVSAWDRCFKTYPPCMTCTPPLPLHRPRRRRSEWVHVEGDFAGIMLVIMPCRSEKSQQGVAR